MDERGDGAGPRHHQLTLSNYDTASKRGQDGGRSSAPADAVPARRRRGGPSRTVTASRSCSTTWSETSGWSCSSSSWRTSRESRPAADRTANRGLARARGQHWGTPLWLETIFSADCTSLKLAGLFATEAWPASRTSSATSAGTGVHARGGSIGRTKQSSVRRAAAQSATTSPSSTSRTARRAPKTWDAKFLQAVGAADLERRAGRSPSTRTAMIAQPVPRTRSPSSWRKRTYGRARATAGCGCRFPRSTSARRSCATVSAPT